MRIIISMTILIIFFAASLSGCIGDLSDENESDENKDKYQKLQVIDIVQGENGSSPSVLCFNLQYCSSWTFYEFQDHYYFSSGYPTEVHIFSLTNSSFWLAPEMVSSLSCAGCQSHEKSMEPIYFEDRAYFFSSDSSIWMHNFSTFKSTLVDDLTELGNGYPPSTGNAKSPGKYLSLIIDDTWFFSHDSDQFGQELWALNLENHDLSLIIDTATGTYSGSDIPMNGNPGRHFSIIHDNKLLFSSFNGNEHTLWIHDPNERDTWEVSDFNWGPHYGALGDLVQPPLIVNNVIYFSNLSALLAYNLNDNILTVVVDGLDWAGNNLFENRNGVLYFDGKLKNTIENPNLWAHNLSNSSTFSLDEHVTWPDSNFSKWYGNTLYYSAESSDYGREMWAYNSVNLTTWIVSDINLGSNGSSPEYLGMSNNGVIYFSADDGILGRELWAHDTKNSTTWLFSDINAGSEGSNPGKINFALSTFESEDCLFFAAYNIEYGLELWRLIL